MPKIISTIVDMKFPMQCMCRLYAKNNFYYCRYPLTGQMDLRGYMPKIISTIVDSSLRSVVTT